MKRRLKCVFAILTLALTGCSHTTPPPSSGRIVNGKPVPDAQTILVGVDRSESTDKFRGQTLNQLDFAADFAASKNLPLEVWAFDRTALMLYRGVPDSHDNLRDAKRKELAPDVSHPRTITRPVLLLEAWIQERHLHPALATYAVILSDGDSEVYTDRPRFVTAVKTLSADPKFHLALIGINPEDRSLWDGALASAMPGRYVLADEQNGQAQLAQFMQTSVTE